MDEIDPKNVIASLVTHRFQGRRKTRKRWHWRVEIDRGLSLRGDGADLDGWGTQEEAEEAGRQQVTEWLQFVASGAEDDIEPATVTRNLPTLLRAAERRVNANVWPNASENQGADSHLASIPANRDTDTDLLLIEAADSLDRIRTAFLALRNGGNNARSNLYRVLAAGFPADGEAES